MVRDASVTSRIMASIKSKNTKPELLLGKAMWHLGLRYRKHYKILGKPDFVFLKVKLAVFCDGDFWHGNNWRIRGLDTLEQELNSYSDYWKDKISNNIERDAKITLSLIQKGWRVIRIWESDIKYNPQVIAKQIQTEYINLVRKKCCKNNTATNV